MRAPVKKTKVKTEHQEQVEVIRYWESLCEKNPRYKKELLFAIPNGGRRSGRNGFAMVQEGLRKGVPDLFLAYPTGIGDIDEPGLFIEMKRTKGGVLSEDQKKMIEILENEAYKVVVAYGAAEAIAAINEYLGIYVDERNDNENGGETSV